MPLLANLVTTDTFRTWYNRTNDLINEHNTVTLVDGIVPYGVFAMQDAANTSFGYGSKLNVNSSLILIRANSTFAANVVVSSNAAVFNMTANTLLLQSPGGTVVNNSPLSVNATAAFLGAVSVGNTVTITGNTSVTGTTTLSGNTVANGTFNARQLLYTASNAMPSAFAMASTEYDNFGASQVAAFHDCGILNLDPDIDTVITGFEAPTNVSAGGRILWVQNIDSVFKVTFPSANTSSAANNRFKTTNDIPIDLLPGAAIGFIWTSQNKEWRPLSPPISSFSSLTVNGLTLLNGNTTVNAIAQFNANSTFGTAPTLVIDTVNNRVGVRTAPSVPFHVSGNAQFDKVDVGGVFTATANVVASGNNYLGNSTLILDKSALTATFANTITANASSQSYIRNILTTTLTSNQSATLSNVSITGNSSITGVTTISGTAGRLVIPVGTGKYAT